MSYSRWCNSVWYTYHSTASDETLDGQVFEICGVGKFTYRQLKDDIGKCVDMSRLAEDATPEQATELRAYMEDFMGEVEREFKRKEEYGLL